MSSQASLEKFARFESGALFSPRIRKTNGDPTISFSRVSHVSNNSETKFFMGGDDARVSGNAIAPCDDSETDINMAACSPVPPGTVPARTSKRNLGDFVAVNADQ